MLYDYRLDIPQLLTVARFKEWAKTQPPEKTYEYSNRCNCALTQYLRQHFNGLDVEVRVTYVSINNEQYPLPDILDDLVQPPGSFKGTFGELVKRAELISA